jgi:cytochrome P450
MPSIDLTGFPTTLVDASLPLAALGGSAVLVCLFALNKWKAPKRPPGPPGNWIIGNALDVPIGQEWLGWDRLRREYGNIVYLHLFGRSIVLLSDPQMIIRLLEKRSSITSDRPELVVAGKTSVDELLVYKPYSNLSPSIGFENSTVGIQHNAKHREARKLFNQTIGRANATKYDTLVEDEMIKLVGRLIKSDGSTKELSSVVRQ